MIAALRQLLAVVLSLVLSGLTFSNSCEAVGNRKQMTSTLPGVAAGLFNYDANDRFTAGDTYDANGNTTASGGIGNAYDFENHLVQKGGVTIVYDGDGNRVKKTTPNGTTLYLVDTLNPTGYARVIAEEAPNTAPLVPYVYVVNGAIVASFGGHRLRISIHRVQQQTSPNSSRCSATKSVVIRARSIVSITSNKNISIINTAM